MPGTATTGSDGSDTESTQDDIEPKLKYVRLSNDVRSILLTSSATCIAVHPKFLCIGSHWGVIHVFDHDGNNIPVKEFRSHAVAVNHICIDRNGDFVVTCSDDGRILVHNLFEPEYSSCIHVGRPIKCLALDPNFNKDNCSIMAGDCKINHYVKTAFRGQKSHLIHDGDETVSTLSWGEGNFVAWATRMGVRVYDASVKCSLGLIKWDESDSSLRIQYRCNIHWADNKTLLIGWMDTVQVCVVRKRTTFELKNRDLPRYLVDPVSTFQTECYICGIAPFEQQLVLLGRPKEVEEDSSPRPQLYIIEHHDNDYNDICTDSLSVRGYEVYTFSDYHLAVLKEESRFFIVAPHDVVVASPYELDDRVTWFLQHNKFEEALDIILQQHRHQSSYRPCKQHSIGSVGVMYLDHLLANGEYEKAARVCPKIFGRDTKMWEEEIYKFATVHQLRSISSYVPRSAESKLNPHIYEMILYEYLKLDANGFLALIKEWDHSLYNISAVINAVLEHLLQVNGDRAQFVYLESLAILYSYQKRYDKSLSMYLKLKHKDVFQLIHKHQLYAVMQDMLSELMDLDHQQTITLLLERTHGTIDQEHKDVAIEEIVSKLRSNPQHLFWFLDEYDRSSRSTINRGRYHRELVQLYAVYARDKLLAFLQQSDHYPIEEALRICRRDRFYPEMVYLLGRMGDLKEALHLIIHELHNVHQAIAFCQEHDDPDLWCELIAQSIDKRDFITVLLQCIGTYVDPMELIKRIQNGMQIEGLKQSLIKMLHQYNLQVAVQSGSKKILVSDYFNLLQKLVANQQRGIAVHEHSLCGSCHGRLIDGGGPNIDGGGGGAAQQLHMTGTILFNCKHAFHKHCLPSLAELKGNNTSTTAYDSGTTADNAHDPNELMEYHCAICRPVAETVATSGASVSGSRTIAKSTKPLSLL